MSDLTAFHDYEFFKVKGPEGFLKDFDWSIGSAEDLEWTDFNSSLSFESPENADGFLDEFWERGGAVEEMLIVGFHCTQTTCFEYPYSLPSALP